MWHYDTTAELIATSILLTVNPKELLLDQSLEVFGRLANISDQEAVIPANNVITLTLTSPSDEISQFKVNTKEEGTYQLAALFTPKEVGEWKISASFDGTEALKPSKRNTAFTVAKGLSVIALDNEETIALGSEIELAGNLTPQLSQQKVSIKMIKPDGSVPTPIEVDTGDLGVFKQQVKFDMSGSWEITATWAGNDNYEDVIKTLSVAVSSEVGKAILVLGGGDRQNN